MTLIYKGKELRTGSEYYSAAMELAKHDDRVKCFRGALAMFLCGAEMNDKFCIMRLKEVLNTPKYSQWVNDEERKMIIDIIVGKRKAEEEYIKLLERQCDGFFGVFKNRPINRVAAGLFKRDRDK